MKIATEELTAGFNTIKQVGASSGILASQYVKLESTGKELLISLTGVAFAESHFDVKDKPWRVFVDRNLFGAFLATAKGKEVEFVHGTGDMVIRSGKQKMSVVKVDDIPGYQRWKPSRAQEFKIPDYLRSEIGILAKYAPTTQVADHLNAVVLHKGYGVMATDQFVVAACLDPTVKLDLALPVAISSLMATLTEAKVLYEAKGAALQEPHGYLYQGVSDNCRTKYPLKSLKKVIGIAAAIKPQFSIEASSLAETIKYMQGFIFEQGLKVSLDCQVTKKEAAFEIKMNRGQVQRKVAVEHAGADFKFQWPILAIAPWVDYVESLDPDTAIRCTCANGMNYFRAVVKKRTYVFVITEVTA